MLGLLRGWAQEIGVREVGGLGSEGLGSEGLESEGLGLGDWSQGSLGQLLKVMPKCDIISSHCSLKIVYSYVTVFR